MTVVKRNIQHYDLTKGLVIQPFTAINHTFSALDNVEPALISIDEKESTDFIIACKACTQVFDAINSSTQLVNNNYDTDLILCSFIDAKIFSSNYHLLNLQIDISAWCASDHFHWVIINGKEQPTIN